MRRQYPWKLTIVALLATLVSCPAAPVRAQDSETPSTNHAAPSRTQGELVSPRPCKAAVSEARLIVRGDDYLVHRFTSPGCSGVFHTTISTGTMRCLASSWSSTFNPSVYGASTGQIGGATSQQLIDKVEHDKRRIYIVAVKTRSTHFKWGQIARSSREVTLSVFRLSDGALLGAWKMPPNRWDVTRFRLIEDGATCCGHSITFKGDKAAVEPLSGEGPPTTTRDNER